jgi:hypothetical protein
VNLMAIALAAFSFGARLVAMVEPMEKPFHGQRSVGISRVQKNTGMDI